MGVAVRWTALTVLRYGAVLIAVRSAALWCCADCCTLCCAMALRCTVLHNALFGFDVI